MVVAVVSLLVFAAVFVLAELRRTQIGIAMFAAAAGVGLLLVGQSFEDILDGVPLDLLVVLVGVTYFFGIAAANGTVRRLIDLVLSRVGDSEAALPVVFFVLTACVSALGSPVAGLVMPPIAMAVALRRGMDPMLMALAVGTGISAGGFAPISLYGIVVADTADSAGIALNPLTLFGAALGANLVLLVVAYVLFGRRAVAVHAGAPSRGPGNAGEERGREPFEPIHRITALAMLGLVAAVVALAVLDVEPAVGALAAAFGTLLALIDPAGGKAALAQIDWSTVLLVGGVITYVGVLQEAGSVDLLGDLAAGVGVPLLAAFVLCLVCGLVSAFASTLGILAALVPLAVPLAQTGGVPGWALICALGICSSLVDLSPFSTVGATIIATTTDAEQRPRLTALLLRWGLSMVVVGPVLLVGTLVVPPLVAG